MNRRRIPDPVSPAIRGMFYAVLLTLPFWIEVVRWLT